MDWQKIIQRYDDELQKAVIPFWQNHGVDREFGGYFTFLDRDGSLYDTEKFMWMQWRIVYMFAVFYKKLSPNPEWLEIARQGFDFLTIHGKAEDGNYYFSLNRRGEPTTAPSNIFSECFAAMGAAALFDATGEAKYREEAESAMAKYLRRMDAPKGRWEKAMPARPKRLSHGHFMMLANLGCVMKECLGTDAYEADAAKAIDTVLDRFWNDEYQVLFENIGPDGSFDLETCEGRMLNPGHALESMWFVMNYAEQRGNQKMIRKAADIVRAELEFGADRQYGGLYYFMDVLKKPHLELQWDMKLWWPHCEAIISTLYAYRLTGEQYFLDKFLEIDEYSWKHFRDPEFPEWFAYLNRQGEPTHMLKGGKWKTMFHLPRCLFVAAQQMRLMK